MTNEQTIVLLEYIKGTIHEPINEIFQLLEKKKIEDDVKSHIIRSIHFPIEKLENMIHDLKGNTRYCPDCGDPKPKNAPYCFKCGEARKNKAMSDYKGGFVSSVLEDVFNKNKNECTPQSDTP